VRQLVAVCFVLGPVCFLAGCATTVERHDPSLAPPSTVSESNTLSGHVPKRDDATSIGQGDRSPHRQKPVLSLTAEPDSTKRPVNRYTAFDEPDAQSIEALPTPRAAEADETLDGVDSQAVTPVSLASILELATQQNPQVNVARQRVIEAYAQLERSETFWLPSIRAGVNYNKHEGRIQDVAGNLIETSRGALYTGLGAGAVGAGSPTVPGLYASFHLTDALFQPKIVSQVVGAQQANSRAVLNDTLLQVSQGYLELLRAEQERAIAEEVHVKAKRLADITAAYARTGQGLASDDDRAQVELALRRNELQRAEEQVRVTSARLSQLLSTDPTVQLQPQEPAVAPIALVDLQAPVQEFVAAGLSNRPEVSESGYLVCEAVERLRRERFAPLLPSVLLGVSYGGMGGGLGGEITDFGDRFDADAVAWWEVRNLGLGERAIRDEANSRVSQARLRQVAVLDRVSREVVEAHVQAKSREKQIEVARDAVRTAEESYAKNLERIENAQGLPIEALQSIQALAQARREYLRAVTDYNLAQFSLHRALGWQDVPLPR
jgi:outer membrane protein TolC